MIQKLAEEFAAVEKRVGLRVSIPTDITNNLSPRITLRPYQEQALKYWLIYGDNGYQEGKHLLFHMATGSGKTVLMAALILNLYSRGYRKFVFFVNSAHIVKKTKENFLNQASAKYLFAPQIRIEDKVIDIREVKTFDDAYEGGISILFTTIQNLHRRIWNPRENAVTIEDFQESRVVMISDEAHHLNVMTKSKLTTKESENRDSWEGTVDRVFRQNPENMLLEFTATVDWDHEKIQEKYAQKVLYEYSLRKFCQEGYSKDIKLRRVKMSPEMRMMQAAILSQYRRKLAEAHGMRCKPVILMKSGKIEDSKKNEEIFTAMMSGLTGDTIQDLRSISEQKGDKTLSQAFTYILGDRNMKIGDFVLELQNDFARERIVNVNELEDLKQLQIELNTLEDESNEVRVIFAVNKLNEGWDVLNLFDIVRLYDSSGSRTDRVVETTMAEAQLIGRGARYFPFFDKNQPDVPQEKRKYDRDVAHPLRILEELHYHCSHNPKYIEDIKEALEKAGLPGKTSKTVHIRLKDSFKKTEWYGFMVSCFSVFWTDPRRSDPVFVRVHI